MRRAGIKQFIKTRYQQQGVTLMVKDVILIALVVTSMSLANAQAIVQPESVLPSGSAQIQTSPIAPIRGSITDRNGVVLAVTSQAHTVFADQRYVTDPEGEARKLAPLLKLDPAELAEDLTGDDVYVVLKRNVSPLVWGRIQQLKLNGIYEETTLSRVYPEGSLGANVLGFVNFYGEGAGGLENALNDILAGVPGERRYTRVAGLETADTMIKAAQDGKHVRLTIERDIQWVAQQAIAERVKYAQAESGSVVVLNVKTGEVLAMATAPTFDPNNLSAAKAENLGNRVLSNAYEPGSTGKIMTMAAVIEEGVAGPESKFQVPYKLKRVEETYKDHEYHERLNLTLTGILAQSSNVGTILASEKLPNLQATLYDYWEKFGIGQSTGLNFPGENAGALKALEDWNASTAPTYAFGQGYSVNALQAASIFATIANDGLRMTPSLVAGYVDNDGNFEAAQEADSVRVVSEDTAKKVRLMLESVVSESGTAPGAKIPGYRVAGKTGTAEIWNNECNDYCDFMASFIGMAPADQPEIVVAVSIVKPKNGHYGGVLAGPVFKRVMSFALQQLRIPPTGTKADKYKVKW